jgi:IS30 family transposase
LAEREEISRAVVAGQSIRIAALLGRAASTVSREIKRNGGKECYRASQADQAAWDRGHRPKLCKLAQNRTLARIVTDKLRRLWSSEQIAGWLKHTYPRESHRVSHETIYRSLFIQARGALKKELLQHLRRTLVERQTRYVMLVKTAGKDTETVVDALIKNARKLPQELYKSLTWDRGKEMAGHRSYLGWAPE